MSSSMYSEHAERYDLVIRENAYNAHYERPSLLALLPELAGKKVLDLGCGPGVYAELLVAKGAIVTAVDASSEMVRITQEKLGPKSDCYVQDLHLGLPKEDGDSYDIVIAPLMIHYLSDLSHLFKDIGRVLKAGGIFAFSTHHPWVDFQSSPSGNYFECELITEEWGTVGKPVEVSYYRRPMSAIFQAIKESDMCVIDLTEGKPNPELEEISNRHFKKLSTKPTFIFVKCSRITNNNPKIAK